MNAAVAGCKADLRRRLRQQAAAVPAARWQEWSRLACDLLRSRPEWAGATQVLLYYPLQRELDLRPVLREALSSGRTVALPRYRPSQNDYEAAAIAHEERDLQPGWSGIPEPRPTCPAVPLNQLDLVLVPGVGFDSDGRRLGRGKGFYDRLLATVRGIRCGVAVDWQLVDVIPTQPHDEPVNCILMPTRWIACRPRAV